MDNIVDSFCATIATIFKDVSARYEINEEIIKQCNGEQEDILHEIELSNSKNAFQGFQCYKELREVRTKRRSAKQENELMQEIYAFLQANDKFKNQLCQIQGTSRKIWDMQQRREYTPRQKDNLTITNKTCKTDKPFKGMLDNFNAKTKFKQA